MTLDGTAPGSKAFISYCWEDEEHRAWVKALHARLRDLTDTAICLDQESVLPGDDVVRFMSEGMASSQFVLMICTPSYKTRFDQLARGVGLEAQQLLADLLLDRRQRCAIPVLRRG